MPASTFPMKMRQSIVAVLIACGCLSGIAPAFADPPSTPPNVYRSLEAGKQAHNAGELHGRIESVDYAGGSLVVRTGRGAITVAIVPNTTIYRGNQYGTLADLRPGQQVRLSVYEVGGRLVAQLIRFAP